MTIGELSAGSGVPASTIRYWEKVGVLPRPARTGGQRRYAQDALHRISVLRLAQDCGFRLDEMRHLMHGFEDGVPASRRWREMAVQKRKEVESQMSRLAAMRDCLDRMMGCECADLIECGRRASAARR